MAPSSQDSSLCPEKLVGEAYKKSVMGIQTGQIIKLHGA